MPTFALSSGTTEALSTPASIAFLTVFGAFFLVLLTLCCCTCGRTRGSSKPQANRNTRRRGRLNENQNFAGSSFERTPSAFEYAVAEEQQNYMENDAPPPYTARPRQKTGQSAASPSSISEVHTPRQWPSSPSYPNRESGVLSNQFARSPIYLHFTSAGTHSDQPSPLSPLPHIYVADEGRRAFWR